MATELTEIEITVQCEALGKACTSPSFGWKPWDDALPELDELRHATKDAGYRLPNPHDAVAVQVWLDVPLARPGVADPEVRGHVDAIVEHLADIAAARHPKQRGRIVKELSAWLAWACETPAKAVELTALGIDAPSHADDLRVRTDGRRALFVSARSIPADGTCPGVHLRFAVGPDRFGLRVDGRPERRTRGRVAAPNEPMTFGIFPLLNAFTTAVDALGERARTHEQSAHAPVDDMNDEEVRRLLGEHSLLFSAHTHLAARQTETVRRLNRLTASGRDDAVTASDPDLERLAVLEEQLEDAKGRIDGASQYLVAASSFELSRQTKEQGERTELLARVAAILVPPTLVVGALGANVLPWDDTDSWEPIVGMLILMVASALGASLVVAQVLRERAQRWKKGRAATVAVFAVIALLGGALGVWLLLDGTTVRSGEPEVRVIERVVEHNPVPVPVFGPGK